MLRVNSYHTKKRAGGTSVFMPDTDKFASRTAHVTRLEILAPRPSPLIAYFRAYSAHDIT